MRRLGAETAAQAHNRISTPMGKGPWKYSSEQKKEGLSALSWRLMEYSARCGRSQMGAELAVVSDYLGQPRIQQVLSQSWAPHLYTEITGRDRPSHA